MADIPGSDIPKIGQLLFLDGPPLWGLAPTSYLTLIHKTYMPAIINKPKHPKRGEYKEQNGSTQVQENKRTTKEGKSQGEYQVSKPLLSREAYPIREWEDFLKGCLA
jgi:hypothetical protein